MRVEVSEDGSNNGCCSDNCNYGYLDYEREQKRMKKEAKETPINHYRKMMRRQLQEALTNALHNAEDIREFRSMIAFELPNNFRSKLHVDCVSTKRLQKKLEKVQQSVRAQGSKDFTWLERLGVIK